MRTLQQCKSVSIFDRLDIVSYTTICIRKGLLPFKYCTLIYTGREAQCNTIHHIVRNIFSLTWYQMGFRSCDLTLTVASASRASVKIEAPLFCVGSYWSSRRHRFSIVMQQTDGISPFRGSDCIDSIYGWRRRRDLQADHALGSSGPVTRAVVTVQSPPGPHVVFFSFFLSFLSNQKSIFDSLWTIVFLRINATK